MKDRHELSRQDRLRHQVRKEYRAKVGHYSDYSKSWKSNRVAKIFNTDRNINKLYDDIYENRSSLFKNEGNSFLSRQKAIHELKERHNIMVPRDVLKSFPIDTFNQLERQPSRKETLDQINREHNEGLIAQINDGKIKGKVRFAGRVLGRNVEASGPNLSKHSPNSVGSSRSSTTGELDITNLGPPSDTEITYKLRNPSQNSRRSSSSSKSSSADSNLSGYSADSEATSSLASTDRRWHSRKFSRSNFVSKRSSSNSSLSGYAADSEATLSRASSDGSWSSSESGSSSSASRGSSSSSRLSGYAADSEATSSRASSDGSWSSSNSDSSSSASKGSSSSSSYSDYSSSSSEASSGTSTEGRLNSSKFRGLSSASKGGSTDSDNYMTATSFPEKTRGTTGNSGGSVKRQNSVQSSRSSNASSSTSIDSESSYSSIDRYIKENWGNVPRRANKSVTEEFNRPGNKVERFKSLWRKTRATHEKSPTRDQFNRSSGVLKGRADSSGSEEAITPNLKKIRGLDTSSTESNDVKRRLDFRGRGGRANNGLEL
ncbi:MAG: hypothetical protein AAGA53_02370 [Pseudomonadota bacterium]